jgi:hypothetical protein
MRRSRKRKQRWLLPALCVAAVVALVIIASYLLPAGSSYLSAAVVQSQVIALTNTERAQNDVGQLTENAQLDAAAQAKAADMAAKGYFSHVGPDGKEPWAWIAGAGYDYEYAGENLAVKFTDSSDVVNAWMASPTHRANIVKPEYTDIGVGVADGTYQGEPATFVVQYFASPASADNTPSEPVGAVTTPAPSATPVAATPAASVAATSAPQVEGAQIQTEVAISAPFWQQWLQNVTSLFATAVHSLTASVVTSQSGVIDTGAASTSR